MASKNRERKAINAVECPECRAPRGEMCRPGKDGRSRLSYGRPMLCVSRRLAWQMIRDGEIVESKHLKEKSQ